jgi:spore germination protein YaaH
VSRSGRGLAGLALLVGLLLAACQGSIPSADPSATDAALATPSPTSIPTPVPEPQHEVYGFVPYWEMDDGIAAHLAATDLTTLALFSVTHRRSGELAVDQNGYRAITGTVGRQVIAEAHARGLRVEVVYTSFGRTKNERFYTEPEAQARWIDELVTFVETTGVDGVNVDVEGLPAEHVAGYGAFVGALRDALRERLPDAQVSVATQGNARGAAMAHAASTAGADRIFLMGYDYRYEGSDAGATSPLERGDGESGGLISSLDLYAALGVPVERTLLGLPLYGMTWPVDGPELAAPAVAEGNEWIPRLNLRVFEAVGFAPIYDALESVEFYSVQPDPAGPWQAVYFDSPRSLTPKLALADARGLAGVGFWAIGYERGLPGYTELIATFREGNLTAAP